MSAGLGEPLRAIERMVLARGPATFRRRAWFAVTLCLIFSLHAALLLSFLRHDEPVSAAQAEETPVEVVAQMPEPPPPPKDQAKQQAKPPAAQQPPEKPATSAPRAQNDETIERDSGESESRAPKAKTTAPAPPPTPEAPQQPKQQAQLDAKPEPAKADSSKPVETPPPDAAQLKPEEKAESAAPPPDANEAEALDKAPPEPPRRPAALARSTVKPPPKPPAKPPERLASAESSPLRQSLPRALDQLAGSSDLPDYVFAKPQRKPTKYKGGSEDNRYLAVVYAMVTQSHEAILLPDGDWRVAVAFQVDGHGDLVGVALTESSGYREVDAAAVDAVRRAAPFPPPPSGGLTGLIARLSSAHARAALAEAERARADRGRVGRGGTDRTSRDISRGDPAEDR